MPFNIGDLVTTAAGFIDIGGSHPEGQVCNILDDNTIEVVFGRRQTNRFKPDDLRLVRAIKPDGNLSNGKTFRAGDRVSLSMVSNGGLSKGANGLVIRVRGSQVMVRMDDDNSVKTLQSSELRLVLAVPRPYGDSYWLV